MSTVIVDRDELVKALQGVRLAVDSALRVLGDKGTPPPLPSSQPADALPVGCSHQWVAGGFGSTQEKCGKCGATR